MDGIKLNALCVRAVDYKDNKTLITLCTVEKGKIEAMIRGAKSEKSKLRYAASLLCFGEYVLSSKNGYYTVIGCSLIDGFYQAREDLKKFYAALSVTELLDKLSLSNTDISEYVLCAVRTLKDISYGDRPYTALLKYIDALSMLSGYGGHLKNTEELTELDDKLLLAKIAAAYRDLAFSAEIRVNAVLSLLKVDAI